MINITFITAANLEKNESLLSFEWIGIILLSLIGFIFIARSAKQIQKIKQLQEELNTYHENLSDALDTMGGKNA